MAQKVTRSQILSIFKRLHQVRKRAFKNDERALNECRKRINDGFEKNKNVTDEAEIFKLFKTAEEVEMVMRTQLVQMELIDDNTYRMHIREETHKSTNVPYNPDAETPKKPRRSRKCNEVTEPKES